MGGTEECNCPRLKKKKQGEKEKSVWMGANLFKEFMRVM